MLQFPISVLFLCTGNSARSILAECLLNRMGAGRVTAHSAGSHPAGRVNPGALALLAGHGYETGTLESKSWERFAGPDAPPVDIVVTVCDAAAGEPCPVWPGAPLQTHWGLPDPAAVDESPEAIRQAFEQTYGQLERRLAGFLALPLDKLEREPLKAALDAIGAMEDTAEAAS